MIRYLSSLAAGSKRPALFLDRDGTLNRRVVGGYVTRIEHLELIEPCLEVARLATEKLTPIVVVSNQGAIARNLATEEDVLAVTARLLQLLARRRIRIDAVFLCPHHPLAVDPMMRSCGCRKPAPGLFLQAASDLNLDLERSVMLGDQPSDLAAALAAGIGEDRCKLASESTDAKALAADVSALFRYS
jgi:D-glycero-D-manno-heptose 1,7-bisphosphate phosphatase